ncbi:MarR family winged helix-turn-helix transcriptional regulator [Micromonospora sp. CPCC 205556]|uniref:MarR family winged helix-turn-helix transcriptional regulator n=1 Tax=Micromonospora sp. CPCC 205556 TaxID=3122398 RepID=UPI002FF31CF0
MSPTPALDGQVLGQAHHATRAVLERELARLGISFTQSVVLGVVAREGGAVDRAALTDRITGALKVDEPAARATIAELAEAGLIRQDDARVALTAAGRDVRGRVDDAVAGITARLYAGIPAEEMAVAGRVLALVKRRADEDLAAGRG